MFYAPGSLFPVPNMEPGSQPEGWYMGGAERSDFGLERLFTNEHADAVPTAVPAAEVPTSSETPIPPAAEPSLPASDTDTASTTSVEWPSLAAAMTATRRNKRSGSGNANANLQGGNKRPVWHTFPLGHASAWSQGESDVYYGGQPRQIVGTHGEGSWLAKGGIRGGSSGPGQLGHGLDV